MNPEFAPKAVRDTIEIIATCSDSATQGLLTNSAQPVVVVLKSALFSSRLVVELLRVRHHDMPIL